MFYFKFNWSQALKIGINKIKNTLRRLCFVARSQLVQLGPAHLRRTGRKSLSEATSAASSWAACVDSTSTTATEALHPIDAPPVQAAMVRGLANYTNSNYYYPPVPHPIPPPQSSYLAIVSNTARLAMDGNPSM